MDKGKFHKVYYGFHDFQEVLIKLVDIEALDEALTENPLKAKSAKTPVINGLTEESLLELRKMNPTNDLIHRFMLPLTEPFIKINVQHEAEAGDQIDEKNEEIKEDSQDISDSSSDVSENLPEKQL